MTISLSVNRYIAPSIATDITTRPEHPNALCWVYKPLTSYASAREWARRTLTVHRTDISDDDFIVKTNQTRLPYEPLPMHKQYFGCHLILRPSGLHSFFMHKTHALLDGRPSLYLFSRLCEMVSTSHEDRALSRLPSGGEVANLTVDYLRAMDHAYQSSHTDTSYDVPERFKTTQVSLSCVPSLCS